MTGGLERAQDTHRFSAHHVGVSEEPPESQPAPPDPDPHATRVIPPDRAPVAPQPRFVDRLWSLRAVIAVALASVILGGLGGAALASASGDQDGRRGPARGPGMGPGMGPGGQRGVRPGPPGWYWREGPRESERRGMGQDQWDQEGPAVPPGGVPTPKASPSG